MSRSSPRADVADAAAFTTDTLLRGRVTLLQPARGYRTSLDPVLLAGFVAPPFGRVLDIGCGSGALIFLLLAGDPAARGVGVELQPRLARLQIIEGDVCAVCQEAAAFDLVATNPPYRPVAHGRSSPDEERARAHHELTLTLRQWLSVAARAVRPGGRVAAVYPAERLAELTAEMEERGLVVTRLRHVYSRPERAPVRVLVEATQGARWSRPQAIEPPLVVHTPDGHFSPEVARMLGD
jgi:tRNA1Val (adenine37-N6)-methyltransferase